MQYVYASSTWQGGAPIPFSSILLQLPMTTSYSLGASHRILERRDFPTHRDSAGRVHLRPPPPKWADGHWLQWEGHPTSHSYWMRLPKVSLLAWQVYLEGLTLASAVYKKKAGTGMPGETPSLSPCATRVLFSTCAFQHYHTAFRLERVFQLGLWCFSASCFSTQWDLKILKCSRMDSAWKVPDRTDTKKAPFNYNIQYFLDWILHGFMSCKLNLQLKQILKFLFNIPGAGDIEWLDKWYSWHFDLGLFFSASQHSNCFSGKYCLSAQKKTTKKRFHGVM